MKFELHNGTIEVSMPRATHGDESIGRDEKEHALAMALFEHFRDNPSQTVIEGEVRWVDEGGVLVCYIGDTPFHEFLPLSDLTGKRIKLTREEVTP